MVARSLQQEGKSQERLRIKMVTLVSDLLGEGGEDDPLGFGGRIREAGLCEVWDRVLVVPRADRGARREDHLATRGEEWPLRQEHDTVEKVLGALVAVASVCKQELAASEELRRKLGVLAREYEVLRDRERAEDEGDSYFSEMARTISVIVGHLREGHTEL